MCLRPCAVFFEVGEKGFSLRGGTGVDADFLREFGVAFHTLLLGEKGRVVGASQLKEDLRDSCVAEGARGQAVWGGLLEQLLSKPARVLCAYNVVAGGHVARNISLGLVLIFVIAIA